MQSTNYQNMRSYRLAVTHPNTHLDFLTSGLMHAKGLPGTISLPTHTRTRLTALFWNYPVSQYQKGKTNLDFTEASDSEWQWHQLGCMQVCTLLQTENHASTPPLRFLQAGCPSCRPTNTVKALKAKSLPSWC